MIGVDTSVLVSIFVNDDPVQHAAAKTLFRDRRKNGPVFVCNAVLLEAVWTLKKLFGYEDDAIRRMLLSLCSLPNTVVEHMDVVFAYASNEDMSVELADALIAAANRKNDCKTTLTFDTKTVQTVDGMELLT